MTMEVENSYTNRELMYVPDDVVQNIGWKELDFSKNQITALQSEFGNLLNLKVKKESFSS